MEHFDDTDQAWTLLMENETLEYKSLSEKNNIDDILNLDYKSMCIKKILEYQNIIAIQLKIKLKDDIKICIDYLQWLSDINDYICKKFKLEPTPKKLVNLHDAHKLEENCMISRSSYKFCEYSHNCEYNYPRNIKKIKKCRKHHFVYNSLKIDLDSLILYLNRAINCNLLINYEEINKCVNTICYVINKMYEEVNNLYYKYGDKYTEYLNINLGLI